MIERTRVRAAQRVALLSDEGERVVRRAYLLVHLDDLRQLVRREPGDWSRSDAILAREAVIELLATPVEEPKP